MAVDDKQLEEVLICPSQLTTTPEHSTVKLHPSQMDSYCGERNVFTKQVDSL